MNSIYRFNDFQSHNLLEMKVSDEFDDIIKNIMNNELRNTRDGIGTMINTLINLIDDPRHDDIGLSDKDGYITFNGGKNEMRVGRFVNQLMNRHYHRGFTDRQIELFVTEFVRQANLLKKIQSNDIVVLKGNDIIKAYGYITKDNKKDYGGTLKNSCMNDGVYGRSYSGFFRLYAENDNISLATIWRGEPFKSVLEARALLWEGVDYQTRFWEGDDDVKGNGKVMDRIYYNDVPTLRKMITWGTNNDYMVNHPDDNKIFYVGSSEEELNLKIHLKNTDFAYYPYLDTFRYADREGNFYNNKPVGVPSGYIFTSTGGERYSDSKYNRTNIEKFSDFRYTVRHNVAKAGDSLKNFFAKFT